MAKKSPNSVDVHVGNRIRTRRLALGMSQEKLGDGLGLTFQQVQKYEKGVNRVGASRLQAISAILEVPISFFFDGASPPPSSTRKKAGEAPSTDFVTEFLKNADSHTLIKAFLRIKEPVVRRSIVQMVEAISALNCRRTPPDFVARIKGREVAKNSFASAPGATFGTEAIWSRGANHDLHEPYLSSGTFSTVTCHRWSLCRRGGDHNRKMPIDQ